MGSWNYTLTREPGLFAGRGFTAHEYLEDFNLYNMNGRLYDPVVGRFLSPDPYVQTPGYTQSYNRYSYCLNNPLKYADPNGEFFLDPIVWLGNYLINWLDNTLNKEMSAKEAFKQTPIAINQNYSPSANQFSNPQAEAQKTARTIEKRGVEIEQNISNIGQNYGEALRNATNSGGSNWASDAWSWTKDHFYVGAEGEITYGPQLAATLKNGLGFNINPYSIVKAEGSLNNKGRPLSIGGGDKLKILDFGLAYYVGVNYNQTIDYSSSYLGTKTHTISVGAFGVAGVTLNYNDNWKFISGYGGIDISGKVAAIYGASGSIKLGFEF